MSDSKFLKFQDIDNDGLIDVCDDDLLTPPAPCKAPCVPDPFRLIPDWKTLTIDDPFLNVKICHFQVTKETPYDRTASPELIQQNNAQGGALDAEIDRQLEEKFKEFEDEAIDSILDIGPEIGPRLNNEETREIVRNALEYKKFDLDPKPGSRLKLLYSIPFDIIFNLRDAPVESDDSDIEDETGPGWEKVTFNAEKLSHDMIKVRKALNFYSKLLKVSAQIGEGQAYFVNNEGQPMTIFNLEDYGDPALFSESKLSVLVNDLKRFLANRNMALPDSGPGGDPFGPIFDQKVTKIKFSFKDKELRVMRVFTRECGNKPKVYTKRSGSMRSLLAKKNWSDPTAVNYFMNSTRMASQISARVQIPWRQYVEKYTFPEIKITNFPVNEGVESCLYGHLRKEVNEFGQNVLDEVFGLGDMIAYLYSDTLCRSKLEETLKDDEELNKISPDSEDSPFSRQVMKTLARNQKYKKLKADDDVVMRMCVSVLSPLSEGAQKAASNISADIPNKPLPTPGMPDGKAMLFKEVLQSLKLCGLLDLLFDATGCLMGGLTLQDALPVMLKSALDAMGIRNFGELFIGLPPEKQAEMDALVQAKLSKKNRTNVARQPLGTASDPDGGFFEGFGPKTNAGDLDVMPGQGSFTLSDAAKAGRNLGAAGTTDAGKKIIKFFNRPWEDEETVAAEAAKTSPANTDNYGNQLPPSYADVEAEKSSSDRTIVSQLDSSRKNTSATPVGEVMTAYVEAMIEVYSDNLILLLDELNDFPGAPLLRDLMALSGAMCPRPPLFTPGLDTFIKSLDLAFCRDVRELQPPSINLAALELKMLYSNIKDGLKRAARFLIGMIIVIVVNQLISTLCQIISKAICKALETTGDILVGLATGGPGLSEIIRENICGPDVDEETLNSSIVDMMSALALGPSAFVNRDNTIQFANDLSSAVTRQEFADALMGNSSPEFLEAADQMIEYVHQDFREALPNKSAIARFAKNIGNFLPLEFREVLYEYSVSGNGYDDGTPANPSICSSPEQINKFKELRCELLGDRVSAKQCEQLFCDLRDDNISDLEDLTTILNNGVEQYTADKVPNIISEPGCSDGLLPYETPEALNMAMGFVTAGIEALELEYLDDMMGTGFTFFGSGDKNFGFLNMVLSDTNGMPLTNHHRKSSNRRAYVNFTTNVENGGEPDNNGFFKWIQGNADFSAQQGQYPYYVGEWMKRQFLNAAGITGDFKPGFNKIEAGGKDLAAHYVFESTNTGVGPKIYEIDLDDLGYSNIFGKQGRSTFTAPDFGYNTVFGNVNRRVAADLTEGLLDLTAVASFGFVGAFAREAGLLGPDTGPGSTLEIMRLPRKGDPDETRAIGRNVGPKSSPRKNGADIVLSFKDNSSGTRDGLGFGTNDGDNTWSYGFEMQCYYSDIEIVPNSTTAELRNRPDDNIRVQIVEKVNYAADRRFANPLAKTLASERTKLPPFDLPNWLEDIPLIGWVIEKLIQLIMLPFSALISGFLSLTLYARMGDRVTRSRAFEFIAIDDGLDGFAIESESDPNKTKSLNINDFQEYGKSLTTLKPLAPQIYALADLTGRSPDSLKGEYDSLMTEFYREFAEIIGTNHSGWLYGANFEFLTGDDYEYGIDDNGTFIPYDDLDYDEEDMVLGISYNEFRLGKENARIVYLDPAVFGGKYTSPPMHVKPQKYDGWWGMIQAFFPGDTSCKPHGKNLINFDEIKQLVSNYYPTLPEDTRLYEDPECVREVPFDKILHRSAKMGLYTLVLSAIRIYASTHLMKSCGTFSAIAPQFPDNYSSLFSAYIVERMEEAFKDAQPAFWEAFNTFKDEEFWYGFLEQSVECYDFLVNAGELPMPVGGGYLQRSIDKINNLQTNYAFTYKFRDTRRYTNENNVKIKQTVPSLFESKLTGQAGFFESLKGYRERMNFEGIKSVEDDAKIILQELVKYELNKMGKIFVENMQNNGFNPQVFDLDYWVFENKCTDSTIRIRSLDMLEVPVGLPTKNNPDPFSVGATFPGPYYTPGGQFRVAVDNDETDDAGYGDEYVGYYHVHMDDDDNEIYMVGAVHDPSSPHDVIVPVADIVQIQTRKVGVVRYDPTAPGGDPSMPIRTEETIIPIGDVPEYASGTAGDYSSSTPFRIEKFVSINGTKYNTTEAKNIVHRAEREARISDVYPGTIKLITNEDGKEVGIEGNMGVRHGLVFYYQGTEITSVEVDALDFKVKQFQPVQANSKLLLCLLRKLKHDPKYKLLTSYIFSMKKITSTLAVYNDMGFLASVGEVTPGEDDCSRAMPSVSNLAGAAQYIREGVPPAETNKRSHWDNRSPYVTVQMKPGARAFVKSREMELKVLDFGRSGGMSDAEKARYKQIYGLPSFFDDKIEPTMKVYVPGESWVGGNEGWDHPKDRPAFTPFTLSWDEWDRQLLRNSVARIKKLFRMHYYSRNRRPGDRDRQNPAAIKLRNLKARLFPSPGAGMLPWWKRKRLKGNPYDAKGNLCDGPDILD